jgi:hypothetical protein
METPGSPLLPQPQLRAGLLQPLRRFLVQVLLALPKVHGVDLDTLVDRRGHVAFLRGAQLRTIPSINKLVQRAW